MMMCGDSFLNYVEYLLRNLAIINNNYQVYNDTHREITNLALNKTQKKKLNEYFTTHPKASDREIAREFKLTHVTVGKYRKEFMALIDKEFLEHSIKKNIFEMRRSVDHWHALIEKLNVELEKNEKVVVLVNDGQKMQTKVPLEPLERVRIIHEIADLEVKIQEWGNDPEIAQILKVMSTGQVQTG